MIVTFRQLLAIHIITIGRNLFFGAYFGIMTSQAMVREGILVFVMVDQGKEKRREFFAFLVHNFIVDITRVSFEGITYTELSD